MVPSPKQRTYGYAGLVEGDAYHPAGWVVLLAQVSNIIDADYMQALEAGSMHVLEEISMISIPLSWAYTRPNCYPFLAIQRWGGC